MIALGDDALMKVKGDGALGLDLSGLLLRIMRIVVGTMDRLWTFCLLLLFFMWDLPGGVCPSLAVPSCSNE